RHSLGEYQLTLDDVMENRWFDDTIAIGSYPVDVPPNAKRTVGIIIGAPDRYGVPFRCLVPQSIDGMLVVGRSASYTSLAAGSARVIPLGMAEGDAAGVAAAYAKNNNMTFRKISRSAEAVTAIQLNLQEQGAYLQKWEPIVMNVENHWAYEGVKTLRNLGLVYGNYANDYRLEEPITRGEFIEMAKGLLPEGWSDAVNLEASSPISCGQITDTIAILLTNGFVGNKTPVQYLVEEGILAEQLQPYFADDNRVPNRAEVIMLLANVRDYQISQLGFAVYNSDGTSYEPETITMK
ncbi:MAG: FAD-dependent oxidoreductase, partial [Peptococcaceae bacterium]|nr:FAD-dependent oxidoreductase [Peptococcaceae bacterium]